jgi:hypothetical protein
MKGKLEFVVATFDANANENELVDLVEFPTVLLYKQGNEGEASKFKIGTQP